MTELTQVPIAALGWVAPTASHKLGALLYARIDDKAGVLAMRAVTDWTGFVENGIVCLTGENAGLFIKVGRSLFPPVAVDVGTFLELAIDRLDPVARRTPAEIEAGRVCQVGTVMALAVRGEQGPTIVGWLTLVGEGAGTIGALPGNTFEVGNAAFEKCRRPVSD